MIISLLQIYITLPLSVIISTLLHSPFLQHPLILFLGVAALAVPLGPEEVAVDRPQTRPVQSTPYPMKHPVPYDIQLLILIHPLVPLPYRQQLTEHLQSLRLEFSRIHQFAVMLDPVEHPMLFYAVLRGIAMVGLHEVDDLTPLRYP